MPSDPSGPPDGASGIAIVQRRADCCEVAPVLVVADHRLAERRRQLGELRSLAAQRARRGRELRARGRRRGSSATPTSPRRRRRRTAPRAAAPCRRARSRRSTRRRRASGTSSATRRRSASSMSAAPSVMRAASASSISWRRSDSAALPGRLGRLALARAPDRDGHAGDDGDHRDHPVLAEAVAVPDGAQQREHRGEHADHRDVPRAPAQRHREHRQQVPRAAERRLARGDVDHRQDRFRG